MDGTPVSPSKTPYLKGRRGKRRRGRRRRGRGGEGGACSLQHVGTNSIACAV